MQRGRVSSYACRIATGRMDELEECPLPIRFVAQAIMTHRPAGAMATAAALIAFGFGIFVNVPAKAEQAAQPGPWRHATSLLEEPKYPAGFSHFDYVNPDAPKGGTLRLSSNGGFDTLNPIPARGELAEGLGLVFETLMTSSFDEASAQYGLLAEALNYPDDYSSVTYRLRADARWHDGMPVTPEDVIFSFEKTVEFNPQRQFYYQHVVAAEKTGEREVTFRFDETDNRELPQIVGQLLILPKHWWEATGPDGQPRDISATTLEPLMGSGPYRIATVTPGATLVFERVEDHWARDLNVNVGKQNFDRISYTYFTDRNVAFEAFKGDVFDIWFENEAKRWATGYDVPAVEDGRIKRVVLENNYRSSGVLVGFIPNLRLEKFSDPRIRRALNLAFDFEDLNRTIFFNSYDRINSYFYGTDLASSGLPQGDELAILEELRDKIPASVFEQAYENPVGGTPQKLRANLREAVRLFGQAGYEIRDGRMVNAQTGEAFAFEILLNGPIIERVALPYAENLKRIGVDVSVRTVDPSQYVNRWRNREFDMIYSGWAQSISPGNEQLEYWGSRAAERPGSTNYAGIDDPAIDILIRKIIFAKDRDGLVAATRALDRVLLANHFTVPTYTLRADRIAMWDRFEWPEPLPAYSLGFPEIWWSKTARKDQ